MIENEYSFDSVWSDHSSCPYSCSCSCFETEDESNLKLAFVVWEAYKCTGWKTSSDVFAEEENYCKCY